MREPVTPYAHTKFKLHKLKHITLKIEVTGCNGAWGNWLKMKGKDNKRSLSNSEQSIELGT